MLLIGFAPTLLVVSLSIALLSWRPNVQDLTISIIATVASLVCGILLKYRMDTQVFAPLRTLAGDIARLEPGLPIKRRPPMLDQLVIALERRMSELDAHLQSKSGDLEFENARLEELVSKFGDTIDGLRQTVRDQQARSKLDDTYSATIATATSLPMDRLIAGINMLTAENLADPHDARRIISGAGRLVFLAREAGNFDYSQEQETQFDIRQLTDEAIAALSPALAERQGRILPFYDIYGHRRFVGHAGMIRALVFNYLLINWLFTDTHRIGLHITYLADGRLVFALTPSLPVNADLQNRRLATLMSPLAANIDDGMLRIPVAVDEDYEQPQASLRALIVSTDEQVRACLSARLESMHVMVTDQQYDVDMCVTDLDDDEELLALREKLADHTRLLLAANTSALPLHETRQLSWPIEHDELAAELLELADSRAANTPLVLAVDDNPSNLKLLALQLNELGVAVETADNGATALALSRRHGFSMIIADMQLPDVTGLELTRKIRSEGIQDIPIVILTARISDASRQELLAAGINDVLVKPATRTLLAQLLLSQKLITRVPPVVQRPALRANRSALLQTFEAELSLKLANNRPDVAEELLDELIVSLPFERTAINTAFAANELEALQASVHLLHGALQYCGLPRLKNTVARLETVARGDSEQAIRLALSVFNSEVDAVLAWYDPHASYFDTSILRGAGP